MKRKGSRRQRNPKVIMASLIFMFVFIAELLFYTWCRVQCVRTRYEITEQTAERQQLLALQDNLKIELARLRSPQRIAKIAKNQFGLMTPTLKQTIVIKP
jgi:cell division protein FtsL